MECEIAKLADGRYRVVSATRKHLLTFRKFQALTPAWQLKIERLIDIVLEDDHAVDSADVIEFRRPHAVS